MWFFWMVLIAMGVLYFGLKKPAKGVDADSFDETPKSPSRADINKALESIKVTVTLVPDAPQPVPGDDNDAWEGAFYDVTGPQRSAKKTVRISYCDGNGKTSERVVDVRAYESSGASGLVIGRCHMRNATRTFRFDRMQRVVDEETGEIIADLQKCLNGEWEASPQPVLDLLYDQHKDVLKLLLYMAKADGAVRAAEIGVITRYCADATGDARITPELVKDMLQYVDVVSITTFVRTYNKLRRERPDDALRAADACKAIVATQKTVHPNEQSALDALAKPLPA